MISRDVYLFPILNNVPRLLGLLNRNISSSTYGCFDREFWHYNTVDIACARKQEGVLTLALLYLINHESNKYYKSSEILEYIEAAMLFWIKIQNGNGSFNEWYPNEHSFVVTSFSSYAVSESLLLLREDISGNVSHLVINALKKTGDWLLSRHETRVMNQQTGAAIALLNISLLADDVRYGNAAKQKISLLLKRQSKEGWFLEYGGPDIGYLSLAIDYLSKYYKKTDDEQVFSIITRSLDFIKYFIQPNLVAGGEYTSRNTEYLIPHGFEIMSKFNRDASFASSVIRKAITTTDTFPYYLDDRYLTYNGYTWLQAYVDGNKELDGSVDESISSFFNKPFRQYFEEAGLLIVNDESKHVVINVNKGGAFRLYDRKAERTFSDAGILIHSQGNWYTSGWLSNEQGSIDEEYVHIAGKMWKVPDNSINTMRFVLLRLFQMTFGRSCFISLWIKERLRDILITKTKPSDLMYDRTITLRDNGLLEINDGVVSGKANISGMTVFNKDTTIYVPSSRYFTGMKEKSFHHEYSGPVKKAGINWKVGGDSEPEFIVK